ncbi:MAG: response regulator [Candidatus Omnitrophota bacterium]|nr:response regulator [Candidatus Omnitrophota bacterium]MDZ4243315.1 response regulator [Candidatus Omnitrophota bacterium]
MSRKKPRRILVVDDDLGMIRLLEKWLNIDGKNVLSASDGTVAVRRAKEEVPDLIVLDLMLPDIGGVTVTQQLKADERTRNIPIIFITSTMGVENDKGDEQIEIDGEKYPIFAKPLHNPKLLSAIRKSLNRQIHNPA